MGAKSDREQRSFVTRIGLPSLDGLTFLRRLRTELRSGIPVLGISARSDLDDRLAGFEHGADGYVVKPIAPADTVVDPVRRFESLELDTRSGEATVNGVLVHLTPKASVLLEVLLRTPGQPVRRREVEEACGRKPRRSPTRCEVRFRWLRTALADRRFDRLETVHGVGYRIAGACPSP